VLGTGNARAAQGRLKTKFRFHSGECLVLGFYHSEFPMPHLPLPPITDFEAYNKNTKEQYEALWRFVVAFESMVDETRSCSINLLASGIISVLIDIPFHHSALTAKPLFEIFRALIADYLKLPHIKLSEKEWAAFNGVLKTIAAEYFDLIDTRNSLLHGTWFMGYSTREDPNSETFILRRLKPTKGGLEQEDVPKYAHELLALKDRCEDTKNWIAHIHYCVPRADRPYDRIGERFFFIDGAWRFMLADDMLPETLPRISQPPPRGPDAG